MQNPEYLYWLKICLYGNENTGKSQLLLRWVDNKYNHEYKSTLDVEFKTTSMYYYDKLIKFQIWDTSRIDKHSYIAGSYGRGTDLAIICIAANATQQQKIMEIPSKFQILSLQYLNIVTEIITILVIKRNYLSYIITLSLLDTRNVQVARKIHNRIMIIWQ